MEAGPKWLLCTDECMPTCHLAGSWQSGSSSLPSRLPCWLCNYTCKNKTLPSTKHKQVHVAQQYMYMPPVCLDARTSCHANHSFYANTICLTGGVRTSCKNWRTVICTIPSQPRNEPLPHVSYFRGSSPCVISTLTCTWQRTSVCHHPRWGCLPREYWHPSKETSKAFMKINSHTATDKIYTVPEHYSTLPTMFPTSSQWLWRGCLARNECSQDAGEGISLSKCHPEQFSRASVD